MADRPPLHQLVAPDVERVFLGAMCIPSDDPYTVRIRGGGWPEFEIIDATSDDGPSFLAYVPDGGVVSTAADAETLGELVDCFRAQLAVDLAAYGAEITARSRMLEARALQHLQVEMEWKP